MSTPVPPAGHPWWVATVAGMASYMDAAAITAFSTALVIFQRALHLSELEVGIATAGLAAASGVGTLIGGRLGDRFGRKPVLTFTMVVVLVGTLALLIAPSFPVILVAVILVGLGTGADLPVAIATVAEAAPEDRRGRMIALGTVLWIGGIVGNGVLAALFGDSGRLGAQILFAHVAVVAVFVLIARQTIPESAAWLAARTERARGAVTVRATRANLRDLLRSPFAVPFVGMIVFATLPGFLAGTNGQYLTYIMVNYGGATVSTAALVGLPVVPVVIVTLLIFMRIADRPVRFVTFQIGALLVVAGALIIAAFGASAPVILVAGIVNAIGGSFALDGIQRVWTQEAFPTLLRATAQGTVLAVTRLLGALLGAVTPLILHTIGVNLFYLALAVLALVGFVVGRQVFRGRDHVDELEVEALASTPEEPRAREGAHRGRS